MSTRRARIKAVTSLPPRRKNADAAESVKTKVPTKDDVEKSIKSPKTPHTIKIQEDSPITSPVTKHPVKNQRNTSKTEGQAPSTLPPDVSKEDTATPKSEKVSVITSTSSINDLNVFRSPKSVGSPLKRPAASPLVLKTDDTKKENNIKPNVAKSVEVESNKVKSNNHTANSSAISDVTDDYNVPSVPESLPEDAMDGIIPLQSDASGPKPIALLKNEIISENAEVLFDPIVPLPSPSKVRPKLRPVPRLAPLRRNSIQGSASESEDESRRALLHGSSGTPAPPRQRHDSHTSHSTLNSLPNREVNRVRNDSICSSVSQATVQPPVAASPHKEKHYSKTRRHDTSRRTAAMRRRREAVKRDTLTMYDLIFYNPTTNPIIPDKDELDVKAANEKAEAALKEAPQPDAEDPDDPPESAAPVPQIKIGPNGEIVVDEQSLVIKADSKRKVQAGVVHEGAGAGGGGGRYRRSARTADWCDAETVRFYRALAALGTDFMLMEPLFPGRTRRDLKLKFKKEERVNAAQVDKALRTSSKWDATKLIDEFREEREAADRKAKEAKEKMKQNAKDERERMRLARELRVKQSRSSKVLGAANLPDGDFRKNPDDYTADGVLRRHAEAIEAKKRRPKRRATTTPGPQATPQSQYATLTLINTPSKPHTDGAKILPKPVEAANTAPVVPANIESGSLVVLTVNDPNSPSKKMLQTYIAHGGGRLTPVALPTSFLNSVVTYMKKGTPKSAASTTSSPHLMSPSSVASQGSRSCSTPGVIQMSGSPVKRQRHSSYTITQL